MDRRYQVFVSSTYDDLRAERAEVMQALLELDCMPAGMELFPAATEEQWKWISRVIEESDYYLAIVGGRYGSIHPQKNLSYTELEYRYAVEIGKPVVAFLHGSPSDIPAGKTERDPERLVQLLNFREYCQQRLCKYWANPADLGGKVSRSVNHLIKRHPATGWIRADSVSAEQRLVEIELREEITRLRAAPSPSSEVSSAISLASGTDVFDVTFYCETRDAKVNKKGFRYWIAGEPFWHSVSTTWDKTLKVLGNDLLYSPLEADIISRLNTAGQVVISEDRSDLTDEHVVSNVRVGQESVAQIRTQLLALGIIEVTREQYHLRWFPTEAGKEKLFSLLTLKTSAQSRTKASKKPSGQRSPSRARPAAE